MPDPLNLVPHAVAQEHDPTFMGTVAAPAPRMPDQDLNVKLSWNPLTSIRVPAGSWAPIHGPVMPQEGDSAVVHVDDQRFVRCVWWGPSAVAAPASDSTARAYVTFAAQTDTGLTLVPLDTLHADNGQNLDLTKSQYVVPHDGIYRVSGHVHLAAPSAAVLESYVAVFKNGEEESRGEHKTTYGPSAIAPGVASGTLAAIPSAGNVGREYRATDTNQWLLDNGSSWDALGLVDVDVPVSTSIAAQPGQFYNVFSGTATVTLPACGPGKLVGVFAGSAPITVVTSDATQIHGPPGLFGAGTTSVQLPTAGQMLLLMSQPAGSGWCVASGPTSTERWTASKMKLIGFAPVTTGAVTKAALNTTDYDNGSFFDAANNQYKAKIAGFYRAHGNFQVNNFGTIISVLIHKNGVQVDDAWARESDSTNGVGTVHVECDVQLAVNDTLDLRYTADAGSGNANAILSVYMFA